MSIYDVCIVDMCNNVFYYVLHLKKINSENISKIIQSLLTNTFYMQTLF